MILSDLAKYSMTRSVARSLCDSWASCFHNPPRCLSHTSSYCRSIVIMTLSCIISEIKRDIGQKSRFFHTRRHVPVWTLPCYRMVQLPDGEKVSKYMFSRFDTIHERVGWTDTARRHSCAMHSVARRAAKIWGQQLGLCPLRNRPSPMWAYISAVSVCEWVKLTWIDLTKLNWLRYTLAVVFTFQQAIAKLLTTGEVRPLRARHCSARPARAPRCLFTGSDC